MAGLAWRAALKLERMCGLDLGCCGGMRIVAEGLCASSTVPFSKPWRNFGEEILSLHPRFCTSFNLAKPRCGLLLLKSDLHRINTGHGRRPSAVVRRGRARCQQRHHARAAAQEAGDAEEGMTVLVIGGGGREHALCYALARAESVATVFCAPGNAGISQSGDATCLSDLKISDSMAVIKFCKAWGVRLVVVGPEAPLVAGLVDDLQSEGILAFGPSGGAAQLEGSKGFMKQLCDKYGIPTASYTMFTDADEAKDHVRRVGAPIVVKADGLAAGKGVTVAQTVDEACRVVDALLVDGIMGSAGGQLVIEECLMGEEVSFFALVDGTHAVPLASAQDHKRVGDGDTGPNTGGMGAYSPAPILTPQLEKEVMRTIIEPTVRGMAEEGYPFVGVLYAGIMLDAKTGKPKLLEYNVRFGDPECQVLMMRLESDLGEVLLAAAQGNLKGRSMKWSSDPAVCVVLAANGYPGDYKKGTRIKNLVEGPGVKIFHAGTSLDAEGQLVATGGRVLGVTALGPDVAAAQAKAYATVRNIDWPEGFFRSDIGWREIARQKASALEKA